MIIINDITNHVERLAILLTLSIDTVEINAIFSIRQLELKFYHNEYFLADFRMDGPNYVRRINVRYLFYFLGAVQL